MRAKGETIKSAEVARAAETHYFIRPLMVKALKNQIITNEAKRIVGNHNTYHDLWQASLSDKFFDMTTLVRLGTAIEVGLRQYHGEAGGIVQPRTFYQRLVKPAELIATFRTDCNYDLTTNGAWVAARTIMIHRHLYAHRSGLVDDGYIKDLRDVTGNDITLTLSAQGYPGVEVYWFQPLDDIGSFIESCRQFFSDLPDIP